MSSALKLPCWRSSLPLGLSVTAAAVSGGGGEGERGAEVKGGAAEQGRKGNSYLFQGVKKKFLVAALVAWSTESRVGLYHCTPPLLPPPKIHPCIQVITPRYSSFAFSYCSIATKKVRLHFINYLLLFCVICWFKKNCK